MCLRRRTLLFLAQLQVANFDVFNNYVHRRWASGVRGDAPLDREKMIFDFHVP